MNKPEQFHNEIMAMLESYKPIRVAHIFDPLKNSGAGQSLSYYNEYKRIKNGKYIYDYPCWFYWYLACVVRKLQPKQVIEIGADKGASAVFMASELPENGKLYSIDVKDDWQYVDKSAKNIIKVQGDSKIKETWKGIPLDKTKLWLIDGDHTVKQVRAECKLLSPHWKKGTVVIFDDLGAVMKAFQELKFEKHIIPMRVVHGTRVGVLIV